MTYYKDFDFNFDEAANDVAVVIDEASINQSIKNIILTNFGEVFFEPMFGSGVRKLLFEKMNIVTETLLKDEIQYAIENFEPRVQINNIIVESDHDLLKYNVDIDYIIIKLNTLGSVNVSLELQSV